MSEKPETRFSRLFHSRLNGGVYFEKTANPFRRGMPDFYYESSDGNILWSEHKHIQKPWARCRVASKICRTASWVAQRHWLERAHNNGVATLVLVGIGIGRKTMTYVIEYPYSFDPEKNKQMTLKEAANYLEEKLWDTTQTTK